MSRLKSICAGLAMAGLASVTLPVLLTYAPAAYAQNSARPEVGKPLQAAADLMRRQQYREAMAKVNEADAVGGKSATETYLVQRMRGAVAAAMGDAAVAAESFDAVISSGRASPTEKIQFSEAVAGIYYRNKDYPKAQIWIQRYLREGGNDPQMRTLLAQTYYLSGDCSSVSKEVSTAGTPGEEQLQMLATCYSKTNDKVGYASAMEKLVTYYPKREYWADLIGRVKAKPGFADRLDLDLYRLQLATGNLSGPNDYMEMGELALQAGLPVEAKKIIDLGLTNRVFVTPADANRAQRLRALCDKQIGEDQKNSAQLLSEATAAPTGEQLVSLGYANVVGGQADKGIAEMEQGIAKNGLKHPDEAKLHLGMAYIQAGKKAKGRDVLRTVKGTDGVADIARMWLISSGS